MICIYNDIYKTKSPVACRADAYACAFVSVCVCVSLSLSLSHFLCVARTKICTSTHHGVIAADARGLWIHKTPNVWRAYRRAVCVCVGVFMCSQCRS
jgi:hypothetical protein